MGNGSALSESLALPSTGFDPTLGVGAISVRLVWDGLGVVRFEASVSLGLEREGVSIGTEGVVLVWLSSLYDSDRARCIKNSLDCRAAAVKALEFLFELCSSVGDPGEALVSFDMLEEGGRGVLSEIFASASDDAEE